MLHLEKGTSLDVFSCVHVLTLFTVAMGKTFQVIPHKAEMITCLSWQQVIE